ncbi:uncharacterized protein LOC128228289 isoform X1 [Mya arenaria]|uniref:uncharacterized protein LOC128228289 isoform X1 n=1 Tax=Mya arenaria TaxID=6604 RepID=UPI0022E06E26|nr:uncharacterized protein LOC128228289 isoform X1 [Mya arenaria]
MGLHCVISILKIYSATSYEDQLSGCDHKFPLVMAPAGILGNCWRMMFSYRKRDRRKSMVAVLVSVVVTYYLYTTLTMPVRFLFINENVNAQCIIPDLDPFDKSIMQYVWSPDPIRCDPAPDLLYVDKLGLVVFNTTAFKYFGDTSYSCSYAKLERPMGDDDSVTLGKEIFFEPPFQVPCDFFRLRCYTSQRRKKVFDTLQESVYVTEDIVRSKHKEQSSQYSVLMFGIDSTSRLSAIRKLPKTYEYLTKHLGAHVFKGYMKVGDNTFPNLVPILTGKRPWTDDLPNPEGGKYDVNPFPFIWQNFSRKHYATFFAEDYPILATFNTEGKGFKSPPTDHYMRPWMLGLKEIGFASEVLKSVLLPFEYNNINLKGTSSLCYGNKPIFKHLINYYKRFVTLYKSRLKFSFSWLVQICHEFINYLELGDDDFYEFFKFLKEDGHLDNAFLIFVSDHGSRIDDIRNTFVGRIEERMPLLSIVPPSSFLSKYSHIARNMQQNTDRLLSNFDLYQTLNDILTESFDQKLTYDENKRGTSLFRSIPETRTCADASIPEHYCACYGSNQIPAESPISVKAANYAVSHLNRLLRHYSSICAQLSLRKIHESHQISLGLSVHGEEESRWTIYKFFSKPEPEKHKRLLVIFETSPGGAMFEATVDVNSETGMSITDDVSRTNKYGNTSICVPEKPLRRYCFCKSNLKDK